MFVNGRHLAQNGGEYDAIKNNSKSNWLVGIFSMSKNNYVNKRTLVEVNENIRPLIKKFTEALV